MTRLRKNQLECDNNIPQVAKKKKAQVAKKKMAQEEKKKKVCKIVDNVLYFLLLRNGELLICNKKTCHPCNKKFPVPK